MLKTSASFSVRGGNLSLVNFFDTNFYVCEACKYKVQFWTIYLDTHAHATTALNRHYIISTTACKQVWLKK